METFRGYDNHWLIPPDPPTHGECENCGEVFDLDDMTYHGGVVDYYLCMVCQGEYEDREAEEEAEEEEDEE